MTRKYIFLYALGALFLIWLIFQGPEPEKPTPDQETAEKAPVNVDEALSECLLPKAQYGQYSSYDGGRSAEALLESCPHEYLAWERDCEKSRDVKTCVTISAITAQMAIKKFNK